MKTIKSLSFLIYWAFAAVVLLSCDNDYDRVFGESTDTRVQNQLNEYTEVLTKAPYGWMGYLKTATGVPYVYHMTFAGDGTVKMLSDFNETTVSTVKSSLWTLKALQSATLSFSTYSYIHLPADPKGSVNGGTTGEGQLSDSEFSFARTSGDSVILEGVQRGSRITFVKATEEQQLLMQKGRLNDILRYGTANKALKLTVSRNEVVTFAFNVNAKTVTAQYLSADGVTVTSDKIPYAVHLDRVVLGKAVTAYGRTIEFFMWDTGKSSFYVQNGTSRTEITPLTETILFNPTTPFGLFIGFEYAGLVIPANAPTAPLFGQSETFLNLHKAANASMQAGDYGLTLGDIYMIFNPNNARMFVVVLIWQNGQAFQAVFQYKYGLYDDYSFDFAYEAADDNGKIILLDMAPILDRIENDAFTGQYIGGGVERIGGLYSKEHPEFTLSGYVSN